jgi:nitrite reductase (NO-forming)/hydroxylamine reductase
MQIHTRTAIRPRPLLPSTLLIAAVLTLPVLFAAPVLGAEPPPADLGGKELYIAQCARCHQPDGAGIARLYPPLRDVTGLWTDRKQVIRALLAGRSGPVEVDGRLFDNVMPTHGYLANETIANTLTFLLREWGPGGAAFTPEEVAAVRLELLANHPGSDREGADPSPLADMRSVQYVTGDGPPITVEEFAEAQRIYYGNCTGCHGVLREGTAGNPLTPGIMRERGTEYLQAVINYGASSGMPSWGTTAVLTPRQINLLARYLQHPVPQPPDMDAYEIRDGWRLEQPPAQRPTTPEHARNLDDLFVVTLHDTGQVMLLDGPQRAVVGTVPVGRSPHRVTASASGRYLYVICRDGTLSMIDLYGDPPERVATVRVGYEARTVGASAYPGFEDRYVLAGAAWPPQLVLLDGATLEPLRLVSTRGYSSHGRGYHPEPRVADITGSPVHPEFVAGIKETGQVLLFPYDRLDPLQIHNLETVRELRAGTFALDSRYYLTPADSNAVSVVDLDDRRVIAEVPARVFGGGTGVAYRHERFGPVWVTSTLVENELLAIGTDPAAHPTTAWQIVERAAGPAAGSLFLSAHDGSPHLWMDMPLAPEPASSQAVAVFQRNALGQAPRTLPVASWSGLAEGPRRAVQPTFDATGTEVWVLVWNPQDQGSAIVVVDDATLAPKTTIRDPQLVTPTRIYNVGALRRRGGS